MKANARPIIIVLAAVALLASVASLYVHFQLLRNPDYSSFCDISETVSCEGVYQSAYGTAFGVPVAAGGAIWSALVLLLAATGMGSRDRERAESTTGYVFVLSVIGLAAVFYFGYASFFVLQRMCLLCIAVYVANIGIFFAASSATSAPLMSLPSRLVRDVRAMFRLPVPATLATSWIIGSVLLVAFFPRGEIAQSVAVSTTSPVETLDAAQLAEWHTWLDDQPREAAMAPKEPGQVLLVKFNDYQCPSCRMTYVAYRDIIARYEAQYPGVFTFETRDFPLEPECGAASNHYGACEAAVAARLAKEKNRGAEMEAWLYDNQAVLSRDTVKAAAREIAGIEDFDARYDAVLAQVREDAQLGVKLGVTGTPTFYLNGIKMPGVRAAHFDAAIAHELGKAQSSATAAAPRLPAGE
jgi:uncharacterized membrane protein/predicted DsbA family dithiol-disulfide isomerase